MGQYYFDKMIPMGGRYQLFPAREVHYWFHELSIKDITKSNGVVHYLDDFLFTDGGEKSNCERLLNSFQSICDELGVPLAPEKTVAPTTVL